MNMASKTKKGFTIIEVILFLAVSGAIIAGVIATTSGTLSRRRYDDAVNDIVSHLRSIYSNAMNTEISFVDDNISLPCGNSTEMMMGKGRSNCVVYGTAAFVDVSDGVMRIQTSKIVGKEYVEGSEDAADPLFDTAVVWDKSVRRLVSTTPVIGYNNADNLAMSLSGDVYRAKWGTSFTMASSPTGSLSLCNYSDSAFSVIVFRDPKTGELTSFLGCGTPNVSGEKLSFEDGKKTENFNFARTIASFNMYKGYKNTDGDSVFICVNPGTGQAYGRHKRLIRIDSRVANESAVRLIDSEDDEYEGACD